MSNSTTLLQRIKRFNTWVGQEDPEIAVETADLGLLDENLEVAVSPELLDSAVEQESIILRRFRPVLRVIENETELKFADEADSEIWKQRLIDAKEQLEKAILATGRINLINGKLDWVGTGWLVKESIVVTNRHIAELFTTAKGKGLTFTTGPDGVVGAEIDFLQEFDSIKTRRFALIKPLYVVPSPGPDIAFFEIEQVGGDGTLAPHIDLARSVQKTNDAATIGYPAYDSRIPDVDLMERIYGRDYNKKRLAPGAVTGMDKVRLLHNCTTLGGNSGSVVIDLVSGDALGLHFSGAFLRSNYAVRADTVRKALDDVLRGRRPYASRSRSGAEGGRAIQPVKPGLSWAATGQPQHGLTMTVPLSISLSLGSPDVSTTPSSTIVARAQSMLPANDWGDSDYIEDDTEARPEDYADRKGYLPDFLGDSEEVLCPLPTVERDSDAVLDFDLDGQRETELRYQHFSVVMNRRRRMCFFSAVNVDGMQARSATRAGWRRDPRIPDSLQILKECYGNPPKFSRGHMTRRNDPSWGPDDDTAKKGNVDSMHVTNATPQMQAFNSPIWLELEDYALENAIEHDMKISVFTGPVFTDHDPSFFGVAVPVAYWKVIAFIHDETGALTATGYRMNQEQSLPNEEEFVFGAFLSSHLNIASQVSIRSIEDETGIDFGVLADVDPISINESVGRPIAPSPLLTRNQIRYF